MSVEGPSSIPEAASPYDQIVNQTRQQHRLFSAHWELTYRCNQKCSHCYLDVCPPQSAALDELTTAEAFRVIDELAALGALNLTLSGGEVLVRHDWFEIAQYARARKFLLRLFTNGILITPRVADQMASLHPYAVELSVYGADAETHDGMTQRARSFELVMRAFQLLRERGIRTWFKVPLMRENIQQFDALRALAESLGAVFRYDITITVKDDGGRAPLQHRLTYADYVWLFRKVIDPKVWVERTVTPETRMCGIAKNALAIDPAGNVSPCVQVRTRVGNVHEQSLREMWARAHAWNELGRITLNDLPVCRVCELQSVCVRCHGLALLEDGDLRAPAMINCLEALARRQVLIEKGALAPEKFPIPAHLQGVVQ
ncbi:MAG: radical SAM protein [Chloroflexi bacterium]|nr:radical SAM protein [Chloroflexota bacterium]